MSDIGHEQTDKELKRLENKITQEYRKATREVEQKLENYLSKFAKKDQQMQKKVENGDMTDAEYAQWRMNQMLTGKRWEEMRDTLAQDLVNADKIAAGMINDTLPDAYALNFNYGTYEVESGAQVNTSFTLYDHDTVERLMQKDPKMIPKARIDIPKDEQWNRKKITSAIAQGILQGESIPKIAGRLRTVTDMDKNAAIRNARTYTTAAENGGRVDSYERANEQGIQVNKMWMATLDDRTRYEHRHLDGMSVPNDEPFEIDGYKIDYPGDPSAEPEMIYNCRCTLVADIKGVEVEDNRNDSKLGEMTYDEWKHALDARVAPGATEEEKTANTSDTAWIDKIKEIQRGELTPEKVKEAGAIMREQIHNSEAMKYMEERSEKYNEIRKEYDDAWEKVREIQYTREYGDANLISREIIDVESSKYFKTREEAEAFLKEANEKLEPLNKEYEEKREKLSQFLDDMPKKTQEEMADNLKEVLSQVREMGTDGLDLSNHIGKTAVDKTIAWAYNKYPTSWVQQSIDDSHLNTEKVKRGYYDNTRSIMGISGTKDSARETAIHEIGHRFEDTVSGILEQEKEFYNDRTKGESLEWLGGGYRKDEKTRKDDFIDPYMGKDYGGKAYELVSMGFEMAYTNPTRLAKDEDMENFIYGVLATVP